MQDVLYDPSLEIPDGQIVGTYGETVNGTKYVAFKGIPYAEPPIGDLRFAVSFFNRMECNAFDNAFIGSG